MIAQSFALQPFRTDVPHPAITITAEVTRLGSMLEITYRLRGALADISLPPTTPQPQRRDQLWQTTCFEFFFGVPDQQDYWEVNLAPTGDWNVYHLQDYRQGLQAEAAIEALAIEIPADIWASGQSQFALQTRLNLAALVVADQPIEMGITAVIADPGETLTYWALHHCGKEPDFHLRHSFVLRL